MRDGRDHVACCDPQGKIMVNGKALTESYLHPGDAPSMTRFSVALGSGQVWVMGDWRSRSADSRLRGPVQLSAITGRVAVVIRSGHWMWLHTPAAFTAVGLESTDTRTIGLWPLVTAGVCILVILGLGLIGIIQLVRRHAPVRTANPVVTQ